jgi:hypothetical protein
MPALFAEAVGTSDRTGRYRCVCVTVGKRPVRSPGFWIQRVMYGETAPCSGRNALVQEQLCSNCATTKTQPILQDCFALTGGQYGEKH